MVPVVRNQVSQPMAQQQCHGGKREHTTAHHRERDHTGKQCPANLGDQVVTIACPGCIRDRLVIWPVATLGF